MKSKLFLAILPMALLISGCASPKEEKEKAQAEYIEQQTQLISEYKDCIDEAGTDKPKLDACESLLKAVRGLPAATE